MATCARICTQIGVEKVDLDYDYCEWLANFLYTEDPTPDIFIKKKTKQELDNEFELQGVTFVDDKKGAEKMTTLYPESREHCKERMIFNIDKRKKMTSKQAPNSVVVDIVVSHGFFIDETALQLGASYDVWCDYCAITSYKLFQEAKSEPVKHQIILSASDEHVQTGK